MSDSAQELLVYGIAAARGGSKSEARYYFEWVLRTDADFDQQADAWYWLSTVSDDPKEQRDCLQNVLSINPNYPEARRDLAILDGRLRAGDVLPETRRDFAPIQPQQPAPNQIFRFECPSCGARTVYDPKRGAAVCQFCGYRQGSAATAPGAAPNASGGLPNGEQDWVAAIYTRRGHRWELPVERAFACGSCGAHLTLAPARVSGSCPFCGSNYLVTDSVAEDLIQPDSIVPFKFEREQARGYILAWLRQSRFRPDDLPEKAEVPFPEPVYIPSWLFDLGGEAHWRRLETDLLDPRSLRRPDTDGIVPVALDDVLVPASKSQGAHFLPALKFDTTHLQPFSDDLLAQWPAEIYSVSLGDAAVQAHEQAFKSGMDKAKSEARSLVGLEEIEIDRTDITMLSYRHCLLPVWLATYGYGGGLYKVAVNGDSGACAGDLPRSGVQRFLGGAFDR